jgi:endonuclease YncB( thermonuclease family)
MRKSEGHWKAEIVRAPALILLLAAIASARAVDAAEPETLAGPVRVIDGDTFAIGAIVVRLADVDAPELAQTCDGGPVPMRHCGAYVADALKDRISDREVRCVVREIDQYDRRISSCEAAGEDLSTWLVSEGLALAFREYSDRLVPEEQAARAGPVGLWQTDFEPPWEYRAKRWEVAVQEAPEGCPIKGNVSQEGERIYHTPVGIEVVRAHEDQPRPG